MKKFIFLLIVLLNYTLVQAQNWNLNGNSGTNPANDFIGTTDNVPITMKVNNILASKIASNGFVSFGYEASAGAAAGTNTAFGYQTLKNTTTISADWSTALGYQAGLNVTTAQNSTFVGYRSGFAVTTGTGNTALGTLSLGNQLSGQFTTGEHNTALGAATLRSLTTGSRNMAIGVAAGSGTWPYTGNDASKIDNDCIFIGVNSFRDISIPNSTALNNAIAIGNNSKVAQSNSLILGGTGTYAVNVGIGNIAPQNKLEITQGASGNSGLRFTNLTSGSTAGTSSGKVLSVNASGDVVLEVAGGGSTADGSETKIVAGANVTITGSGTIGTPYNISAIVPWVNSNLGSNNITNSNSGSIILGNGITTLPNGYKLYVSDGILTEKVKVALKSGSNWADYVFDDAYKLKTLEEVEKYIIKNKCLPNIPSAQTLVKQDGIDVGSMLAKQMEKIEELTLYLIELNKKVERLEKENIHLKTAIKIVNQ